MSIQANKTKMQNHDAACRERDRAKAAFEVVDKEYREAVEQNDRTAAYNLTERRNTLAGILRQREEAVARTGYLANAPDEVPTEDREEVATRKEMMARAALRGAEQQRDRAETRLNKALRSGKNVAVARVALEQAESTVKHATVHLDCCRRGK